MKHPVVHFEFTTADPEALAKFYSDLFGWKTQSVPEDYVLVDTASGKGINGGIGKGDTNRTTVFIQADDLDAALAKIEELGGKTVTPVTTIPDMVTYATFTDPAGNIVGLVKGDPGSDAPGVSPGENSQVDWFEILGKDGKALKQFYVDAFGWDLADSGAEGFDYFMLQTPEAGIPGAVGSTPEGQPTVRFYAAVVPELQSVLDKAEPLGAKTVMEPTKVAEETEIAIFVDPQGNQFGIYKGM